MSMRTVLSGGKVWDGSDDTPRAADVLIEDGKILEIHPGLDGDEAINISGMTILPGLFDCHVHVMMSGLDWMKVLRTPPAYRYYEAARNLQLTLHGGITTVRDAGGAGSGVRDAVRDGLISGPRMHVSIRIMSQTGGHGDYHVPCGVDAGIAALGPDGANGVVDGPDAARRVAREIIRDGADVIKVATTGGILSPDDDPRHSQLQLDELHNIVAEANAVQIPVMAHAHGTQGIKNALHAGVKSIEHGIYLDDECIDLMLASGAYLVPTLLAPSGVVEAVDAGLPVPAEVVTKAREVVEQHKLSFQKAVDAGVHIAMGTDSGVLPHGRNLHELTLMNRNGLSPSATLRAASSSAAALMGLQESLGTLEVGKIADMLIVEGDAFDVGTLSERITQVWKAGVRVR